jgi:hypothetical protein
MARLSPWSWTPPPRTPPSTPSPLTPKNAKPTSAKIQLQAQGLPEGSYGRRNRQVITERETRVTTRLRVIEKAYQTAIEHVAAPRTPERVEPFRHLDRAVGQEIDLEAGS